MKAKRDERGRHDHGTDSRRPAGASGFPADPAGGTGPVAHRVVLGDGWRFGPVPTRGWDQPGADESSLAEVMVPHCVAPLSWRHWDPASWERTFCYRRAFVLPEHFAGMRVFVDFAGAMTKATVHLNGHDLGVHLGGYLPFSYEVTDVVSEGDNLLAVLLDASFDLNVPPNVPAPGTNTDIDYFEPGGIYREVSLRAVPQIFIDDVFAKPVDVLSGIAAPGGGVHHRRRRGASGHRPVERRGHRPRHRGAGWARPWGRPRSARPGGPWCASASTSSPRSPYGTSSGPSSTTW